MNIFDEKFNIVDLDVTNETLFTPLRIIIKNKYFYDEISKNHINEGLGVLEQTLAITQAFPSGSSSQWINDEFGFTIAGFDYISSTIGFILEGINGNKTNLISFLEETKVALNNFLVALINGSYYSATFEMRRICELCLWVKHLEEKGDIEVKNLAQLGSLTSQFSKVHKDLFDYWDKSSEIYHNKDEVYFNWDKVDGKRTLRDYLVDFQKCSKQVIKIFRDYFESDQISSNNVMRRYNKLWSIIFDMYKEPYYDLRDREVSESRPIPQAQKERYTTYESLRTKPNRFRAMLEVDSYDSRLRYMLKNNGSQFGAKIRTGNQRERNETLNLKYVLTISSLESYSHQLPKEDRSKMIRIVTKKIFEGIFLTKFENISKSMMYRKMYKDEIEEIIESSREMLKIELSGKELTNNLLLIRLITEDILFNISVGNVIDGTLLNYLCSVAGIKPDFNIVQYRHVSIVDRIMKANGPEELVDEKETNQKFLGLITNALKVIVTKNK